MKMYPRVVVRYVSEIEPGVAIGTRADLVERHCYEPLLSGTQISAYDRIPASCPPRIYHERY